MDEYRCCYGVILISNESFRPFTCRGNWLTKKKKTERSGQWLSPVHHHPPSDAQRVSVCEWSSIRAFAGGQNK